MRDLNLTLAQTSPKNCDKSHNIHIMKDIAADARRKNADFLVFPELSLTGYVCRDFFYELAEPIDGPSVKTLRQVAEENGLTIIFGMPLEGTVKGVIYNSAVMISADGDIANYNKIYLPTHAVFEEKRYFRPGHEVKSFEKNKCRLGLTVCYDLYFPEIYRILALEGVEVMFCIAASPSTRKDYFEILTKARALENGAIVVFVNRVGIEDGLYFWGGSHVVNPNGEVLAKARYYDEDVVSLSLNLSDLEKIRPFIPTVRDLRTEVIDILRERSRQF